MKEQKNDALNIEVLPQGKQNSAYEQRERGVFHTSYAKEVEFYGRVKDGDLDGLQSAIGQYFSDALVVGRMSEDDLRQTKYFAVSCITLAIRAGIEGGVEEGLAYALSDEYIQSVDKMQDTKDILTFLLSKAVELTSLVANAKMQYPHYIKKAMKYIDAHLHGRIKRKDVAEFCGISEGYLTALFDEYVGKSFSEYVISKKLEESKPLLNSGKSISEVSYIFGFCSQSHYISAFRRKYGQTPKQFIKSRNLV